MNPDQPSREQIEARITALLLGDLPAAEAELLRWSISRDAELKKLHDQLKVTIGFVSEAMKDPAGASVERETPLKMSPERRQKILAHFKTPRPHKLFWLKRIKIPSAYSLAIAAAVILVICGLVAISIPNFVKARSTSQVNACINNLRQIDAAKNELALENGKSKGVVVTENDITPYIQLDSNGNVPKCPGGTYVIGKVGEPAMAELNGKLLTASGSLPAENLAMARGSYSAGEDQSVARNEQFSRFANRLQSVMNQVTPPPSVDTKQQFIHNASSKDTWSQVTPVPPSANAQKEVTVNFQTTRPARIALPNTESSQTESGQNAGTTVYSQSVVGYVNPPTGASPSSVPNQLDTKTASTAETQSPVGYAIVNDGIPVRVVEVSPGAAGAPSAPSIFQSSQQEQQTGPVGVTEIPPTPAGGNYTVDSSPLPLPTISSQPPRPIRSPLDGDRNVANGIYNNDAVVAGTYTGGYSLLGPQPTVSASPGNTTFTAGSVAENSANKMQNALDYSTNGTPSDLRWFNFPDGGGNQSSANSAPITSEVIPMKYAKADEIARTLSSLGVGSGGTVSFGSATTPGTTGSHNGFNGSKDQSVSGAVTPNPGVSAIAPTTYVNNGTVYPYGYNFQNQLPADRPTNFIAGNQSIFYRMVDGPGGQGGESSPRIARENQNTSTVAENSDVNSPINPATGLPEIVNAPLVPATPIPQQSQQQYAENEAILAQPPEIASAMKTRLPQKQADQPSTSAQNNLADNEMIPPGLIDFQGADASQVLEVYAQLTGRTLLRADLPKAQIVLKTDAPLTRTNAIQALQGVLALNGIAVVNVGDKFMKALPASQAGMAAEQTDKPLSAPMIPAPIPQPEILTRDNAFSTFSLNVSDVSFKLAAASLEKGQMPAPDSIRSEEFINAFDYRDPEPLQGQPLAFRFERAQDPFAHERDLLRFSIKAAAAGRPEGRALNLVLLLDTSGSMERADRVAIIREALRVLAAQLQPQDTVSVVTFARTARLWADGVPADQAGATLDKVGSITPEGGTNLEEAMRLAYETARRHFLANGMNRVVLLTDGAANLGNVDPQALTQKVETERRQGIALDCFGIGWEDYNDDLLEQLSSNGDGRYAFINSPDEASTEFVAKLAGALQVAAEDVKVQVEFNPDRVTAWRQIGYAKHQLTKQQFRDNTVAAGAIAAREAGNALYVIETKPDGEGPIATVRVRYRVPGTQDNRERSWLVEYAGAAPALAQSSSVMRLVTTAAETSEWLADSPFAQNVTPDELLNYLSGVPQFYGADERPKQLEWMIRQAKSVSGK